MTRALVLFAQRFFFFVTPPVLRGSLLRALAEMQHQAGLAVIVVFGIPMLLQTSVEFATWAMLVSGPLNCGCSTRDMSLEECRFDPKHVFLMALLPGLLCAGILYPACAWHVLRHVGSTTEHAVWIFLFALSFLSASLLRVPNIE
jgi:hypothetical protein